MMTRTTQKTGTNVGGIRSGGYNIEAIRTSLQAMTYDGTVTNMVIDSATGNGLATVVTIADTKRHAFKVAGGMITMRGVSHRLTI